MSRREEVVGRAGWLAFWLAGFMCLFMLSGCSSLWGSVKSAAAPAGGAAGGAALGLTLGPGGAIGGAAIGAVVASGIEENASLRSGETIGEQALDKQAEFWKGRAIHATEAVSLAQQAQESLKALIMWAIAGLVVWFVWRSRHNFRDLGLLKGLGHSLLGGTVCKKG